MKISKRHLLDFMLTFVSLSIGGLIYSVAAGKAFNWPFNIIFSTVIGVVTAASLHRRRQRPDSAQRGIPADD